MGYNFKEISMHPSTNDILEELENKIKRLLERSWKDKDIKIKDVRDWYSQFESSEKASENYQLQFLHLLSKFTYFGRKETSFLLKTLYKDFVKYPEIRNFRRQNNDTLNEKILLDNYTKKLSKTRFLGIGNPSESGSFLLYKFRQENSLSKKLFISPIEIFQTKVEKIPDGRELTIVDIADKEIENYIFIDDLTCSGSQAIKYSRDVISDIKNLNPDAKVSYFVLVATQHAITKLKQETKFDRIDSVFTLDDSFRAFSSNSRYYSSESFLSKSNTKIKCFDIGIQLEGPAFALGYDSSELLLSFEHNTPDNVPSIFWSEGNDNQPWSPIFKRYHKKY